MNNNEINKKKLIDTVLSSSGGKLDKDALNNAINNQNADKLINSLSNSDKEKLSRLMSDKESMQNLLKSPQAQAIMKAFIKNGGKNG